MPFQHCTTEYGKALEHFAAICYDRLPPGNPHAQFGPSSVSYWAWPPHAS